MGIRYTPWRSDASSEVIGRGEFNHYEHAYEYLLRLHGSTPWVSQSVMCSRHRVCSSPNLCWGRNCGTIIDVLILFLSFLTEASTQCATKELISLPARCAHFAVLTLDLHVAASSLLQGHDNDDGATQFASDGLSGTPGAPGNGVHRIRGDAPRRASQQLMVAAPPPRALAAEAPRRFISSTRAQRSLQPSGSAMTSS